MSFEQEKMIVGSLTSLYPLQKFEEEAINTLVSLSIDDDAISRKATTEAIEKCHKQCCRTDSCGDEWINYETTLNEVESIPPMPSNTSNALDALVDAYKGRSNALENQTKWNRMMLHLAELQLTYSPDWGANGQGDQKLYDFVTELIDEFSGWDVPDINVGDTISRQAAINELERTKRIASHELHGGEVLRTFNDVLNSLINIMSLLPQANNSEIPNSSDTISRKAAIDYFVTNVGFHDEDGYTIEDECELRKIWTGYFDGIPPAEPKRIRGRWTCDQCGYMNNIEGMNFCPKCGRKM